MQQLIDFVKEAEKGGFESTLTSGLMKWVRKLEECEFVRKDNAETFRVLDTGKDWSQISE